MDTTPDYVVWTAAPLPRALVLYQMNDVPKHYQIVEGVPRAAGFPDNATHSVNPDFPDDVAVMDAFWSPELITLISKPLMELLSAQAAQEVEYLPIKLLDHKQKPVGDYYILHPVNPIDCLDIEASEAKPGIADPDYIGEIKRLVLYPERIPAAVEIFKVKGLYDQILVSRRLAQAIDAAGFTGVSWTELADFHAN